MNALRQRREKMGLTYMEVAARSDNLCWETVRNWETGRSVPQKRWIGELMKMYEVGEREAVMLWYEVARGKWPEGDVEMEEPSVYTLASWIYDWKLRELAKRAGVTETCLWYWANGERMVSEKHLKRLADALGKSEASVAWASWKARNGMKRRREMRKQ